MRYYLIEFFKPVGKRFGEFFFLFIEFVDYPFGVVVKFRVRKFVFFDIALGDFAKRSGRQAYLSAKADGAADKAAQNITLVDVGRSYSARVADKERRSANVVENNSVSLCHFLVFAVLFARKFFDFCFRRVEKFDVVNALNAV